ncbi:MAG: hypothetical protein E7290_11855 [Lachnospiraceae bacterium]|nr:hypothetical protein [Lachnospiraceae bacterium]
MGDRAVANKYRDTVVCVDSYNEKVMIGRIYNPFFDGSIKFNGLMSFILAMEELLDEMKYPQAYELRRSFMSEDTYTIDKGNEPTGVRGEQETFDVKILFRQNASWQGTILWEECGMEQKFRSVLELVLLMNSALQKK